TRYLPTRFASWTSSGSQSRKNSTNVARWVSHRRTGCACSRVCLAARDDCSVHCRDCSSTVNYPRRGQQSAMAARRELPPDVAAAFDRVPEAGSRFAALPPDRQAAWLDWVDRARGRRARSGRIDEMIRRSLPSAAVGEEEVAEPAGPPPERYWWLWLVLLLLLVVGGLLAWYFLGRGSDKATVPNVIGLREDAAAFRIHDRGLDVLPRTGASKRPSGIVFAEKPGPGTQLDKGQGVTIFVSSGRLAVPDVTGLPLADAQQQLTAKGFKVAVKRVASSRPRGIVIGQEPVAGVTTVSGAT